jgi:hypothetical protein
VARAVAEFRPTTDGPAAARAFLARSLESWEIGDLRDDAAIVLGEIAANVVRHAQTSFTVQARWDAPVLRVEVRDGSSIIPAIRDLADEDGGLGLRMVDRISHEWGIEQHIEGKTVWFTLLRDD